VLRRGEEVNNVQTSIYRFYDNRSRNNVESLREAVTDSGCLLLMHSVSVISADIATGHRLS